jgi:hypothetical protein
VRQGCDGKEAETILSATKMKVSDKISAEMARRWVPWVDPVANHPSRLLCAVIVPVFIEGPQDADKIGHAGSIPAFGHNRNLRIGPWLAPWPNPP